MKFTKLKIQDAWLAESAVLRDNRGSFTEWFKFDDFSNTSGIEFSTKQANFSISDKGVIRGIHYSLSPDGQAKWIKCVAGSVIDFVVDIRPNSSNFMKVIEIDLNASDGKAVFIGPGLGHGFISLEDHSAVSYLLSSPYSPNYEFEINPLDEELKINWHLNLVDDIGIIRSPKDAQAPSIRERMDQGKLPFIKNR